jgi:predicted PurR-regulated permease PerM
MSIPSPTERQAKILWASLTALAVAVLLGLIGFLVWGFGWVLNRLSPVLMPLAIAGVIAYLLDPLVDLIEGRGLPRARAILTVFGLALIVVLLITASVLPQVIRETRELTQRIPAYAARLQVKIEDWIAHPPAPLREWLPWRTEPQKTNSVVSTNLPSTNGPTATPAPAATPSPQALDRDTVQAAAAKAASLVPKIGRWLLDQVARVASWFGILAGLALIPVYAFYFLLEKRGIQRKWTDYLPVQNSKFKDELVFVLTSINDYLIVFFRSQVLVAICDGVLYTIGFFAIGLNYAFLLGVIATVLTIIPFLGAIVTCVAALILAFVQFGDWLHPMLVLVVFGIVQTLEGLVIAPKIMGDRVGLHPLTIIIAVMVGTTLMGGIIGGILAIPLTAALRVVMFRYIWKKPAESNLILPGT